jgi:branched-chain amino acid aminotransferase
MVTSDPIEAIVDENLVVWLDGILTPWPDARIHVASHGLHYGIGFFEGIRCYASPDGPAIFRLRDHLQRLARSAAIYGMTLPFSISALADACKDVVRANGYDDCYLRPIAFLNEEPNPLAAKLRTAIIAMKAGPLPTHTNSESGVRAKVSSFTRISANAIPPSAKATGQYLNAFLAQNESLSAGYDEAILLNEHGYVTDGWAHNIFIVHEGGLITPPLHSGALPGITRDTILTLSSEAGLPVAEQNMVRSDLYLADECLLTGTSAGIVSVIAVDGRTVGDGKPGPVTKGLIERLGEVTTGGDHADWRDIVS